MAPLLSTALSLLAFTLPMLTAAEGRDPERPWVEWPPSVTTSRTPVWPSPTHSTLLTSTVGPTRPGWSATCSPATCVPFTTTVTVSTCASATTTDGTTTTSATTCPSIGTITETSTTTETETTTSVTTTTETSVSISISIITETSTTTTTVTAEPTIDAFHIVARNSADIPDETPMHLEAFSQSPVGTQYSGVFTDEQPATLFKIEPCGGRLVDVEGGNIAFMFDLSFGGENMLEFGSQAEIDRLAGRGLSPSVCQCARVNTQVTSELSCNCGGHVVDFTNPDTARIWQLATTQGAVPAGAATFTPFAVPVVAA